MCITSLISYIIGQNTQHYFKFREIKIRYIRVIEISKHCKVSSNLFKNVFRF